MTQTINKFCRAALLSLLPMQGLASVDLVQERNKDNSLLNESTTANSLKSLSIVVHNEGTPFGGEFIHKFTIPEGDIVLREVITPNGQFGCCDDQYEVLSVPDGYIASVTSFNLKEGDYTVIFIRKWEGM